MKKYIYILTLIIPALVFTSCTESDDEFFPTKAITSNDKIEVNNPVIKYKATNFLAPINLSIKFPNCQSTNIFIPRWAIPPWANIEVSGCHQKLYTKKYRFNPNKTPPFEIFIWIIYIKIVMIIKIFVAVKSFLLKFFNMILTFRSNHWDEARKFLASFWIVKLMLLLKHLLLHQQLLFPLHLLLLEGFHLNLFQSFF